MCSIDSAIILTITTLLYTYEMQLIIGYLAINLLIFDLVLTNVSRHKRASSDIVEDASLSTPELLNKYGYPCDIFEVTTDDGYILEVHRVQYGKKKSNKTKRVPVLIQHGLLCSSADFVLLGVEKGLVYLLADEGFDVWLMNCRGNRYSRKHISLDPDINADYWHFSFHEIGVYDLPAVIDFILMKTKEKKLFHIGHSQGTTSFYVMTSEMPEYNDKIIAHFAYAPTAYMKHLRSPFIKLFAKTTFLATPLVHLAGLDEFLPAYKLYSRYSPMVCSEDVGIQEICSNVVFITLGFNRKEFNITLMPTIVGHFPAGASTNQFLHYGQEVNSGRFCQYDHGFIENLFRYNSTVPPSYNTSKITTPLYFFYSDGDLITDSADVEILAPKLPNLKQLIKMDDPEWSHLDYIIAITAKTKIYKRTLAFMKNYLD